MILHTSLFFRSRTDGSGSDLKTSPCSPVRRTMSATDWTTQTYWPPLLWTESASVLCTGTLERSTQASLSGHAHQRMRSQLTTCRSHDLVQLPTAVISIAPSSSHACLAQRSVLCVRHPMSFQLSSCRLTRKWCWNCPRSLHCFFVFLICMMRSLLRPLLHGMHLPLIPHGMVLSVDSKLGLTALPARSSRQRPSSSIFGLLTKNQWLFQSPGSSQSFSRFDAGSRCC